MVSLAVTTMQVLPVVSLGKRLTCGIPGHDDDVKVLSVASLVIMRCESLTCGISSHDDDVNVLPVVYTPMMMM